MLSDLLDQKFHLEDNTCLFYHRSNFCNLTDDNDYEIWRRNEIFKLGKLVACLPEYEQVIRTSRFNALNAHESYSVLIEKLIMYVFMLHMYISADVSFSCRFPSFMKMLKLYLHVQLRNRNTRINCEICSMSTIKTL